MRTSGLVLKRFWGHRDSSYRTDLAGFLADPDEGFGSVEGIEAESFAAIAGIGCLGMVGEPGSGKSTALNAEYRKASENAATCKFIDLLEVLSPSDLDREIFATEWFQSWQADSSFLTLFLDGLDEAANFFPTIAASLVRRLEGVPLNRLYVRIACRTSLWPESFVQLKELWSATGMPRPYDVYELLPLRRRDVLEAAAEEGIDSEQFIHQVIDRRAVPLAIRPMTLRFLLDEWKAGGALPNSLVELYEAGCLDQCREQNRILRDAKLKGALDPQQRLQIAGRIFATMLFTKRRAVWIGPDRAAQQDDLRLEDVYGDDNENGMHVQVSEASALETVGTALFTSRGEQRFGWAHQTFGEFLAARFAARRMTAAQIDVLIRVPDDPEQRVRPQLASVAAWLATMVPEVGQQLLERDPVLLLDSDLGLADDGTRRKLVDALVGKYDRRELFDDEGKFYRRYRDLNHSGLSAQLAAHIRAPELSDYAKREAIRIARACRIRDLGELMADLAVTADVPMDLRVAAAGAVADMGDPGPASRLMPLAAGDPADSEDELKGAALRALWPNALPLRDLLELLALPKKTNLFGVYKVFLHQFPDGVSERDLPDAMHWIKRLDRSFRDSLTFRDLVSSLLGRAFAVQDLEAIVEPLAKAVLTAHDVFYALDDLNLREPASRRRMLIEKLIELLAVSGSEDSQWPWSLVSPVEADFGWLLGHVVDAEPPLQDLWLNHAVRVLKVENPEHVTALRAASSQSTTVRETFVPLLDRRADDRHRISEESAAGRLRGAAESLTTALATSEEGHAETWDKVWLTLTTALGRMTLGATDVTQLEQWTSTSPELKERVVDAALRFVKECEPGSADWIGSERIPGLVFAEIAALQLVFKSRGTSLESMPQQFWSRWAPTIWAYPFGDGDILRDLRRLSYERAPEAALATVDLLIDKENERGGYAFTVERLRDLMDEMLAKLLLSKLRSGTLAASAFEEILRRLVAYGDIDALNLARDAALQLENSPEGSESSHVAAAILIEAAPRVAFETVWGVLKRNPVARQAVFERMVAGVPSLDLQGLSEEDTAEMVVALAEQFPPTDDRLVSGVVSTSDKLIMLRDRLLGSLVTRGTDAGCRAIASIQERMPQLRTTLQYALVRAEARRREKAGGWPAPREFLELSANRSRRLVKDARDLQDLLIETLADFQKHLRGENPAAAYLWHRWRFRTKPKVRYRPKEENELSDYLQRYFTDRLTGRGVVVNREVQINPGAFADFYVNAVSRRDGKDYDVVTVVLEAKGCWNRELDSNMKTQLVDRYLGQFGSRNGIYVVFWFDVTRWDLGDGRRRAAGKHADHEALRSTLGHDSSALSKGGLDVRCFVVDGSFAD